MSREGLLCISPSFAPATTPTGIRAGKLVTRLAEHWDVTVLTETSAARSSDRVQVSQVAARRPGKLLAALRRARLSKLLELLVWPDESIFWVLPAILAGRRLIKQHAPSAIVVFMMPYSAGLVGLALARISGLPLILNLDDSPTCTDMHPDFPSRLHYRLAKGLEDRYARRADAIVYVSQTNLELVAARQPADARERFHLVRYGADETEFRTRQSGGDRFEIVYVGAMSGWWTLIGQATPPSLVKRAYDAWTRLGRHTLTRLDTRTASPAIIGEALLQALAEHPEWDGRISLSVYDNSYPREVVTRALVAAGVDRVVAVRDPVAHEHVAEILGDADLLFLTLPLRLDRSRGGRISAKTYEYLMTDRPILAALPAGENWDYLADKPGVWLVEPDDAVALREAIIELAAAKLAGEPRSFARERVHEEISYTARAEQFEAAIDAGIEAHRLSRRSRS
ncbi:MAG TPA: glycosyltransferase [Solirubrobacteraceae bacterium]|jgi:glycosyltransferase involved in cell wall biosynthesis|nr:glycosyltransferase [Solirubrobacteraceae bacterium]